jgi:hypothetical protein
MKDGFLYSKIGRITNKVSTINLLQSMGLTRKKIFCVIRNRGFLFNNRKNLLTRSVKEAISKLNISYDIKDSNTL